MPAACALRLGCAYPGSPGVHPICLEGSPADNELCRPENYGLLEVVQELQRVCKAEGPHGMVAANGKAFGPDNPAYVTYGVCHLPRMSPTATAS
jgi:hypothetical protein